MATLGTFTAGQVLTAAELNAIGTWTAFTPSFTNFTLGNGTIEEAVYVQVNELVYVNVYVTLGSTSAMATSPRFTAPVTIGGGAARLAVGTGRARIGTFYWIYPYISDEDVFMYCVGTSTTYATRESLSSTVPGTWGNGDSFQVSLVYHIE